MVKYLFAYGLLFAGACSAVDDFGVYRFDGGATDGNRAADLAQLPGFGEKCMPTPGCDPTPSVTQHVLQCLTLVDGVTVPNGICTRTCTQGSAQSCTDYPSSHCGEIANNVFVCLPDCVGLCTARPDLACCANGNIVSTAGLCAPTQARICGG